MWRDKLILLVPLPTPNPTGYPPNPTAHPHCGSPPLCRVGTSAYSNKFFAISFQLNVHITSTDRQFPGQMYLSLKPHLLI